jgi:hypothetical protein
MSPAIPSSPVAMSANDAGSGFAAMLLASAAARAADDPEPSAPGVAPVDDPPFTNSATGVESSLKALPADGSVEIFEGGEETTGVLGFGELGDFAVRAETDVATRAVVSAPLCARPLRLIIFQRLPSEADGPEPDEAEANR